MPFAAAVLLGSTAGGSSGAPPTPQRTAELAAAERSALLDLYAAETALARAREGARSLERRRLALVAARERRRAQALIVRRSLATTRGRIATLLRRLYVEGEPDPIAVLLGARSLSGMLAGIDELERATLRNRDLAARAQEDARALRLRLRTLARAEAGISDAARRAAAAVAGLESAAAARRATVASLRRRQSLTRARLAALEERARAAQRASARIERRSAPRGRPGSAVAVGTALAVSSPPPVRAAQPVREQASPAAGRELVVDAVAYHLPGRTASGLPVGVGVIAVDPSVIPLGTRVFVPGYGRAVAADVGSAIKGNIIDLWMPSTAAAREWGRRTVTITVYG